MAELSDTPLPDLDAEALEAARLKVEDVLVEFRDLRISVFDRGNGLVIREWNGRESSVIRLTTRDGLEIGIRAYLKALEERERSHG